jgi:RNA-directed DNA polymerase
MYVSEESHSGIVPMNHSNKDGKLSAESGEGRPLIKENARQPNTYPTQSGKGVSKGLADVRKAARENKEMKFTALLHHLTVDLLRESFYSLKRKAAPGVDGVTWQEYELGLEDRLIDLHDRVHRGAYRATPSRRVYIEKADGRQRPLAVPAIEDKLVQQAVVTILNQIYEEDFLGFSYGFRPGRSQHQALDALSYALLKKKVNYILDADIRHYLRIPVPSRSGSFLGGFSRTTGKVWPGAPSRQDAPDRVRAVCRTKPETKRGRQARDVRLPRLPAHQREE